MPKVKTKRAAKKRLKVTANGKVKIKKAGLRHLLEHKSSGNKRGKRKGAYVTQLREVRNIKRCIPYL
jgi:large subunit ribosomal protein L35